MIRIITDSTCDISHEMAEQWGVDVLPLTVWFGEKGYRDGVDITKDEFYRKLAAADKLPTTSQLTPDDFTALFQKYMQMGDDVVGIFLSSKLSGTYQSALIARDMVSCDRIHIVDSQGVTFLLALLVKQAVLMRDRGRSAQEIAETIESIKGRGRLVAAVDTLKYLKMGGRISSTSAIVGGILGISPIIAVLDGSVQAIGKVRGRKAAFAWMDKWMRQQEPDPAYGVAFGHSNSPQALSECIAYFSSYVGEDDPVLVDIGSTVGTHAGPGAVGIAYIAREM